MYYFRLLKKYPLSMKKLSLLIFCIYSLSAQAQTIFTYGSTPVSKEEFLRVYQKNNHTISYDDISVREYLELYENFKLKVKAAEDLGVPKNRFHDEAFAFHKA